MPPYAELQVTTNFSFLRGASHADELVATAKNLGLKSIAVTDRNTLAGAVRMHIAAKAAGVNLTVGARLDFLDAPSLLCLPTDRQAYGRLCRLLTLGQQRAEKGNCELYINDIRDYAEGQIFISLALQEKQDTGLCEIGPGEEGASASRRKKSTAQTELATFASSPLALAANSNTPESSKSGRPGNHQGPENSDAITERMSARDTLCWLREHIDAPLYVAVSHRYDGNDRTHIAGVHNAASELGIPVVATNDVLYHGPERRALQDVLTCIREKCSIRTAGFLLEKNAERYLKSPTVMARAFAGYEESLKNTAEIAKACRFSLDELVYEYPDEPVPPGETPQSQLEKLTWEGATERFPEGLPDKIRSSIEKEIELIDRLQYAPYFLTVHDIVKFARSQDIFCQGRGSAANSVVCYCLGITNVNPAEIDLLFDRFISPERKEPPDIDVDFEHERREEVIQYIYRRYGRERSGLAATVISYRRRSSVRDVGKVMGLSEDVISALAGTVWHSHEKGKIIEAHIRQAGLDPDDPYLQRTLELSAELMGFPRHLSQHVGGFVLTQGPLCEVVPISNAAMEDRTVIEWDKDDIDALRILKVDVLGLGMLTCIHKCFDFLAHHYGRKLDLATVPREDPRVYDMLCKADSLGVFQVESRAQMNMLPRLKPRCFYDLVIEVAIVRPGPIQGDMVHPYLRRRDKIEKEVYPSPAPHEGPPDELRKVLSKTKGVPLFQEQAMRIAMVAAKFSSEEANQLRHAMATFRRRGTIETLHEKMVSRMIQRGYDPEFAERCFNQIKGFGEYGFPESHAASFAHLVYISSWLKCHYPNVFAAGLLNSQPMGFYAPAQIVRDAREHGVHVREVDVNHSQWDCTLEPQDQEDWALRLGFRRVDGIKKDDMEKLIERRRTIPFADIFDIWRRTELPVSALERLAAADCFRSMGLDRRAALWQVRALSAHKPLPLFAWAETADSGEEPEIMLPQMPLSEHVLNDYQTLGLSLKAHPMRFLRSRLAELRIKSCAEIKSCRDGMFVRVGGVVLVRQRPGSASGVVFITLEDETSVANIVVWPNVLERFRRSVMGARLMLIQGKIQRHEDIIHIIAQRIEDRTEWLDLLSEDDQAFDLPLAHADEVKRPDPGSANPRRHPRNVRVIPKSRDFH